MNHPPSCGWSATGKPGGRKGQHAVRGEYAVFFARMLLIDCTVPGNARNALDTGRQHSQRPKAHLHLTVLEQA